MARLNYLPQFSAGDRGEIQYRDLTNDPIKLDEPLISSERSSRSDIPQDQIVDADRWKNLKKPPVTAKYGNLTKAIGGGQYTLNTQNPNQVIAQERNDDYETRKELRGNLDSNFFEIDHIVPLYLGGTDNAANKQILHWKDHDKKTKVQEIVSRLYEDGKISKQEAIANILNWSDKDISKLKNKDLEEGKFLRDDEKGGQIAQKIFDSWSETPKVGIKDFFRELSNPHEEGTPDNPLGNGVFSAFAQGAASGITGGWIRGYQDVPDDGFGLDDAANFGGQIAGTLLGIASGVGLLGRAAQSTRATKAASAIQSSAKLSKLLNPVARFGSKGKIIVNRSEMAADAAKLALAYTAYGQAGRYAWENPEKRIPLAVADIISGIAGGVAAPGIKGAIGSSYVDYVAGRMAGLSQQESAIQAIAGGALHMALSPAQKKAFAAEKNDLAENLVRSSREAWLNYAPTDTKGYTVESVMNSRNISRQDAEDIVIQRNIAKAAANEQINEKEAQRALEQWATGKDFLDGNANVKEGGFINKMATLTGAVNSLEKKMADFGSENYFPIALQKYAAKNAEDFIGETVIPKTAGEIQASEIAANRLNQEYPGMFGGEDYRVQITGTSDSVNSTNSRNILEVAEAISNGQDVKMYVSKYPEIAPVVSMKNSVDPKKAVNPEKTLTLFAYKDNEFLPLGSVPSKRMIDVVNKNLDERGAPVKYKYSEDMNHENLFDKMTDHGVEVLEVRPQSAKQLGMPAMGLHNGRTYVAITANRNDWINSVRKNANLGELSEKVINTYDAVEEALRSKISPSTALANVAKNIAEQNGGAISRSAKRISSEDAIEVVSSLKALSEAVETGSVSSIRNVLDSRFGITGEQADDVIRAIANNPQDVTPSFILDKAAQSLKETNSQNAREFLDRYRNATDDSTFVEFASTSFVSPFTDKPINIKETVPEKVLSTAKRVNTGQDINLVPKKERPLPEKRREISSRVQGEDVNTRAEDVVGKSKNELEVEEVEDIVLETPPTVQVAEDIVLESQAELPLNADTVRDVPADLPESRTGEIRPANKEEVTTAGWFSFGNGDVITNIQNSANKERNKMILSATDENKDAVLSRMNALDEFEDKYTRKQMGEDARNLTSKYKGDNEAAFKEYMEQMKKDFSDAGLEEPKLNYASTQELKRRFLTVPDEKIAREAVVTINKDGAKVEVIDGAPYQPSYVDKNLEEFNARNGTNIEIVSVNGKQSELGSFDSEEAFDNLINTLRDNGYIAFAPKKNSVNGVFAFKWDDKIKELYDPSVAKYKFSDKPAVSDEDKMFRVMMADVFKYPPTTKDADALKRFALSMNREMVNKEPKRNYKTYILPSPAVGDLVDSKFFKSKEKFKEIIQGKKDRTIFDGKNIIHPEDARTQGYYNGYTRKSPKYMKDVIDYGWTQADGTPGKMLLKGSSTIMDKNLREYIKDIYGIDLKPGERIVFTDNVKIGAKKLGDSSLPPDAQPFVRNGKEVGYTFNLPSDSMRLKRVDVPSDQNKVSLSLMAKIMNNPKFSGKIANIYKEEVATLKELMGDLKEAQTGKEISDVFTKYEDKYGADFSEMLHGMKEYAYQLGGGKYTVGEKEISQYLNKVLREKVLSLTSRIKSGHLYLTPDVGYMKNGKRTFLKPDEVMISKEYAEKLGVEEGDRLLTVRYPISRKTAMSGQKVLIGDNYGVNNLGVEQAVLPHHDVFVRKEGDYDGDTTFFFKIGGEDGLPDELLKDIDAERLVSGDVLLPELEKHEKRDLTLGNIRSLSKKVLQGSDGISAASQLFRVLPTMAENKSVFHVKPINAKKSELTMTVNGKKVPIGENGKESITLSTKVDKPMSFSSQFDSDIEKLISQIQQEAVDAVSSKGLAERGYTPDYLPSLVFKPDINGRSVTSKYTENGKEFDKIDNVSIVRGIRDAIKNVYQVPFNQIGQIDRYNTPGFFESNRDLVGNIDGYIKNVLKPVEDAGGQLSALQNIIKEFDGLDAYNVDRTERFIAFTNAQRDLRNAYGEKLGDLISPDGLIQNGETKKSLSEGTRKLVDMIGTHHKKASFNTDSPISYYIRKPDDVDPNYANDHNWMSLKQFANASPGTEFHKYRVLYEKRKQARQESMDEIKAYYDSVIKKMPKNERELLAMLTLTTRYANLRQYNKAITDNFRSKTPVISRNFNYDVYPWVMDIGLDADPTIGQMFLKLYEQKPSDGDFQYR